MELSNFLPIGGSMDTRSNWTEAAIPEFFLARSLMFIRLAHQASGTS
jgi:hypothetical protein